MESKRDRLMSAAIHIGAKFSSYAFSTKTEFDRNERNIYTQYWLKHSKRRKMLIKAPTSVLFDQDGKFFSFGYEAEYQYADLELDKKHSEWYFFKRLQMGPPGRKVHQNVEIEDYTGKKMKAFKVFGAAINYLKTRLLQEISKCMNMTDDDIHWILPVPAVWGDFAKEFMRETAYRVGFDADQLTVPFESEVISLYCQIMPGENKSLSEKGRLSIASPGIKYLIIDLGEGNSSISAHQRQENGKIKEIKRALGVKNVDTIVDGEFNKFLIRIIGGPVFTQFCDKNEEEFLDLQEEFEIIKQETLPKSEGKISFKIPVPLKEIYEEVEKETVQAAIEGSPYQGDIDFLADKIRINAEIFKNFFKPCTETIVAHIEEILKHPDVQGTNVFIMVGRFSESKMLQNAIKQAFKNVEVIIPIDAELAVVKGAVMYGFKQRVKTNTYGVRVTAQFPL